MKMRRRLKNIHIEEFIVEVLANLLRIILVIAVLCNSICNVIRSKTELNKGKDLVLGFVVRILHLLNP